MRLSFFRLLLCLLIAALPLQGYANGGCCAHGAGTNIAPRAMAHCRMDGSAGMDSMAGMRDAAATAAPHSGDSGGCTMHAAHRLQTHPHADGQGAASAACSSACTACASCSPCMAFALPPALPLPSGAAPARLPHAAPIVPAGSHIPPGPERPPRFIVA